MQGKDIRRPRNYGEPTERGFEIAMDKLTDAGAFARSELGRRWREWYIDGVAGTEHEDVPGDFDARRLMDAVYADADESLQVAEPIYVTSEIVDVLDAARATLPAAGALESDLLVQSGFVWLARPIANFWHDIPLTGFAWLPLRRVQIDQPTVALVGYGVAGTEVAPKQVTLLGLPDEAKVAKDRLAELAVTFWLIAGEHLVGTNREQPPRAVRRRAQGREIQTVLVVALRRKAYPDTDGSRKVAWSHRWLVRGFWRQQWYASEGRHKPIWIADYVKGPDDKPFVAKRRAFEVQR